jgi:hypothetical protein
MMAVGMWEAINSSKDAGFFIVIFGGLALLFLVRWLRRRK